MLHAAAAAAAGAAAAWGLPVSTCVAFAEGVIQSALCSSVCSGFTFLYIAGCLHGRFHDRVKEST